MAVGDAYTFDGRVADDTRCSEVSNIVPACLYEVEAAYVFASELVVLPRSVLAGESSASATRHPTKYPTRRRPGHSSRSGLLHQLGCVIKSRTAAILLL